MHVQICVILTTLKCSSRFEPTNSIRNSHLQISFYRIIYFLGRDWIQTRVMLFLVNFQGMHHNYRHHVHLISCASE